MIKRISVWFHVAHLWYFTHIKNDDIDETVQVEEGNDDWYEMLPLKKASKLMLSKRMYV